MRIVRRKDFETFIEGKNEILNVLPIDLIVYYQLASCSNFEDTYSKLKINDITVKVARNNTNGFTFDIIFDINNLNYIQMLLNNRHWELVEEESIGLSQLDIVNIINNKW